MADQLPQPQMMILRAPVGGMQLNVSSLDIDAKKSPSMRNVRLTKSYLERRPGLRKLGQTLGGPVTGIALFRRANGSVITVAWTGTTMYQYNPSTNNWDALTGALTGGTNAISWVVMYDLLVFTNGVDTIKKWDGVTAGYAVLGGAPPKARYLAPFADRLILGYTNDGTDHPQRITYSANGLIEDFAAIGSGTKELTHDPTFIQNLLVVGDRLVIPQEKSINTAQQTGQVDAPFAWRDPDITTFGLIAPWAFLNVGSGIAFMGSDRIYSYDLSNLKTIDDELDPFLFNLINRNGVDKIRNIMIPNGSEWWLFHPSPNSSVVDRVLVYNFRDPAWSVHDIGPVTATGYMQSQVNTTWGAAVGTWGAQAASWGSGIVSASNDRPLLGTAAGDVFEIVDDYVDSFTFEWQSKVFDFDMPRVLKTLSRVYVGYVAQPGSDAELTVQISTDEGASWANSISKPLKIGNEKKYAYYDFFITSDTFQVKLLNGANSPKIQIFEIGLLYNVRGEAIPGASIAS